MLDIVILAAGKGTRMRSALPKVLHNLAGKPLLAHVVDTARELGPRAIHVVYGHGGEQVPAVLGQQDIIWARQEPQLGTGHAVQQAVPAIRGQQLMVLYGDVPLTRSKTLRSLLNAASGGNLAVLTADLADPTGYGRIVRDGSGRVIRIVEQKDADESVKAIREINTGIMVAPAERMREWLGRLGNDNAQKEYYLTDVIAMAVAEGTTVETVKSEHEWEILGVNSKSQLAELERIHQRERAQALMEQGVTLRDPSRFDLRGELQCGQDVEIDVDVIVEGHVTLGDRVRIGPYTHLKDCHIGADTVVLSHCVVEGSKIGSGARLGPFSRVRPDSQIGDEAHIGNFVEIKKSAVGKGSKVNHLSYVGDTTMGSGVNIGAGTITANYDGANKHQTVIEDNASTGSNSVLVAPVNIGKGATVGAGSVVTKDAPAGELTVARARQTTISGWKRPTKKKKD